MILDKQRILDAQDRRSVTVSVPEWGTDAEVLVASMSGAARDRYESLLYAATTSGEPVVNLRATVCASCIVDESGRRVFSEQDVGALGRKNAAVLDRIFIVALRLSGLSSDAIEDSEKNFGSVPGNISTIGSRGTSDTVA